MILNPKESIISYRCPHCATTVMSMIGTFALSGDMIKLKCSCGKSELIISYTGNDKIRITVPCFACGNSHTFNISSEVFFNKDLLELSCKSLGLNICFIGNKEKVFNSIEKSDKELEELMGDYSIDDICKTNKIPDDCISDTQIYDLVKFMLCEMKDENAIVCNCNNNEGEYEFEINESGVEVYCKKCNARKSFHLNDVQKAADFLNIDQLDLR